MPPPEILTIPRLPAEPSRERRRRTLSWDTGAKQALQYLRLVRDGESAQQAQLIGRFGTTEDCRA